MNASSSSTLETPPMRPLPLSAGFRVSDAFGSFDSFDPFGVFDLPGISAPFATPQQAAPPEAPPSATPSASPTATAATSRLIARSTADEFFGPKGFGATFAVATDGVRFEGVFWICDKCGASLSSQPGFSDLLDYWTCCQCGYENPISEDNILKDGEEWDQAAFDNGSSRFNRNEPSDLGNGDGDYGGYDDSRNDIYVECEED